MTLRATTTTWDDATDSYVTSTTDTQVTGATAPLTEGLARQLAEAGVATAGARSFWIVVEAVPASLVSVGDIIVWGGTTWRCRVVNEWGPFSEVAAVRQEPQ